jgi:hypothetical protein
MLSLLLGSVVEFEVIYCDTSTLLLLVRIDLAIWDILSFHMNFKIDFSISLKNVIGIFLVIASNL